MCGWANLRSHLVISFNQNQNPMCSWANLRSLMTIPFNQNKNPLCGWANLRSYLAIPFNQNQNPMCGWANMRSLLAIPFNQKQCLCVLPNGRVWTFFFCFNNFLMVGFFKFFFLMIRMINFSLDDLFFTFVILQDWHQSFLIAELTSVLTDD